MLFSTPLLTVLALTSTALAVDRPARQYRRELSPEKSNVLIPREDIDPTLICGENYVDCNNGWCCSEGETCAGEVSGVPVCHDPTQSFLGGTVAAFPFKSLNQVASSLDSVLSSLTAGVVTATSVSTGTAATTSTAKTTGSATGTGAAAQATNTGAAARLGAWGAAGVLGGAVMLVV